MKREICIKCRKDYKTYWQAYDDGAWSLRRRVWCVVMKKHLCVDEEPLNECPYKLEHLI